MPSLNLASDRIVVSLLPVTLSKAETKKADVKLILDGYLEGFELVGFQVWSNTDAPDTFRVDLPARSFKVKGKGDGKGETRWYSILRDMDPTRVNSDALKSAIIAAFLAERKKGKKAHFAPRPQSMTARPKAGAVPKPTPRLVDTRPRTPRAAGDLAAQLTVLANATQTADTTAAKKAAVLKAATPAEIALAAMSAREADAAQLANVAAAVEQTPALVATADPASAPARTAPRPRRKARQAARHVARPKGKRAARKAPRRRTAARKGGAR
jgi:hypothetical protein